MDWFGMRHGIKSEDLKINSFFPPRCEQYFLANTALETLDLVEVKQTEHKAENREEVKFQEARKWVKVGQRKEI